jgi:phosphinothricin acetyltransferase
VRIEPAAERHVGAIASIYTHAAATSPATFDLEGPSEDAWRRTLAEADPGVGHMLLVALGEGDEVLGYAKSGEHKSRPAYAITCEVSVYVASSGRGRGVGGALYDALLSRLDESPLRRAVAGVAEPNEASRRLHLSRGFSPVGTFHGAGAKRGRTWDVTWYERHLAAPALVQELQSIRAWADAEAVLRGAFPGARVDESGDGIPILDPEDGSPLGSIVVPQTPSKGDSLLLRWCAETLSRLYLGDAP